MDGFNHTFDGVDNLHDNHIGNGHHDTVVRTGFNNGDFVIKSPSMVNGHDTFVNGQHVTHTENNVLGGQNVYHGHELAEVSIPNVHGGVDIFDGNMHHQGSFVADVHGGEDYLSMHGNGEAIMRYHDPLAHSSEYKMNPFDVNNRI